MPSEGLRLWQPHFGGRWKAKFMSKTIVAGRNDAAAGSAERSPSVRWALASLSLSMLLSSLGTSIANVGLPTLAQAFDASFQEVQWIVLAYLLAITTLIVSVGRLGDIIGRRRLLLAGIGLFTLASVLCGAAPTLWLLIAARAVQGLGAAIMMALTMAFVGETVPKARTGSAMGLLGTMSAVGTALGPSLGGVLIAGLGWRAIFLVNVPLGILTFLLAHRRLPADRATAEGGAGRLRHHGHAAAGADARGLCARHDDRSRPVRSAQHGAAAGGRLRSGPLRARRGARRIALDPAGDVPRSGAEREPRHERAGLDGADGDAGGRAVLSLARARARRGSVGLVLSAGPLVAALTGVPAGRIADRFGAQRMTIVGLIGIAAGSFILSLLPATFGIPGYVAPIVVITAGYALFQTANNTAVMTDIPPDQRGVISGMLNLSRNLGLITGASVMGAVFALASAATDITTAQPEAVATGMRITFAVARWSDRRRARHRDRGPRLRDAAFEQRGLDGDEARRLVERAQHALELVAAADDQAGRRHHAVGALAARELGIFFNAVDRHFRGSPEHREHGAILEEVDRVIAPLAGGHHAAVEGEDAVQFAPVEGHLMAGGRRRAGAPVNLARIGFAECHTAPPVLSFSFMIAP